VILAYLKRSEKLDEEKDGAGVKIEGPWQVHVLGALPLRSISRLYGMLNSYTLPVWFRVPGYKIYSWLVLDFTFIIRVFSD
jgi:phosphatidylserine decarboxylase